MAGKKNYELEIVISGGTDASLAASIRNAKKEINGLEHQAGLSARAVGDSFGGMSTKGIDTLGTAADKVFGTIIKGASLAAAGVAAVFGASTAVGMGFESQMSTVQSISQASAADMKRLNSLAKEMGETTQFSAEEAGQGLEYMAMAGWKTQDMIDGLPGIMYLAAASGEELGTVSDIVTDAMTAFGMQANESAHFADVLAQASANSNTNVSMMGETFKYVAPVAGSFGYSIEDAAIATGLMANAGVKGSEAGTAMRSLFTNLAKPTRDMRKYMDALSISLEDDTGEMKSFRKQLESIREGFAGLTDAQKAEYAAGIAGKYGMSGLLSIVNASEEDFKNLTDSIDESAGAAKRMSEVRLDNLKGDITLLKSAAQGAGIEVYEGVSGTLRGITRDATEWITSFTGELQENMPTIQRQVKQFGRGIQEGFGPVIEFGGWCLDHPAVIEGTIMGIITALGAFKMVQGVKNGIGLLSTLSTMISAWPVAAFGVAAGAVVGIATAVKETNKRLKKEDMKKRFGVIKLSMEELDETARLIVDNGNMGKAAEAIEGMGKVRELAADFEAANRKIEKLNWKIGMNFGLDEGDQEDYAAAIDQMVKGSIEIVQQSQYTAQISVQALFGTDSKGNELLTGFNEMYDSINAEVRDLGTQLGGAYRAAMEDGIIDMDEAKIIQELQQGLANVTQQVSQYQFDAKMERIAMQYTGKELDPETFKNLQEEKREALAEQKAALQQSVEWNIAGVDFQASREKKGQEWVDEQKEWIQATFNNRLIELDMRSMSFSTNSITDAYKDVLDEAVPNIQANLDQAMQESMQTAPTGNLVLALDPQEMKKDLGLKEIDRASRDGITELWEGMQPDYEQVQTEVRSRLAAGKEVPKTVVDGLNDAAMIGAIAGNQDAIMHLMATSIADNPEFESILESTLEPYQKDDAAIPEEIAAYMDSQDLIVEDAVNQLGDVTQEALRNRFEHFEVDGTVGVNLKAAIGPVNLRVIKGMEGNSKIAHNAKGGLIHNPTLSWFAEDSPEMAIPIDGSRRSLELWKEAGGMLGAYEEYRAINYDGMYQTLTAGTVTENNTSVSSAPVMSLTIQVTGDGDIREQAEAGASVAFEQFKEWWEQLQHEQYRVSF